jgi:hypothetical protein
VLLGGRGQMSSQGVGGWVGNTSKYWSNLLQKAGWGVERGRFSVVWGGRQGLFNVYQLIATSKVQRVEVRAVP